MCELKYEKKIDVKNTDLKKLRVKELRKICDDEGINTKGARAAQPRAAAAASRHRRRRRLPPAAAAAAAAACRRRALTRAHHFFVQG